jgi:diguanylate cyclase
MMLRANRLLVGTGIVTAAFVALVLTRPVSPTFTRDADDLVQLAAPLLIALPACCWAASRTSGRLRAVWVLWALFALSWGIGQAVWCVHEITTGQTSNAASWPTFGYLLAPVFGMVAVAVYPAPERHWTAGTRAVVDGFLVVACLMFVAWAIAGDTGALDRTGTSLAERFTVMAYPGADIVLLALLATVAGRTVRSWRDPLVAMAACMVALFLGDSLSIYIGLSGTYSTGNAVDAFWFVAFLLLAVAAVLPAAGGVAAREETKRPAWTEMVPSVAIALTLIVAAVQIGRRNPFDTVEQVLAVACVGLLLVRSNLYVKENRVLLTELEGSVDDLQRIALHDPLTGLPNRVLYRDRLDLALRRRSESGLVVAVGYVDLDDFKDVNDTFGHDAGDELLRQVSRRLTDGMREEDTLARLSGDEFALLVTSASDEDQIGSALERLLHQLDEPILVLGHVVTVSASIGFTVSQGDEDADMLVHEADVAMYTAKESGKNRLCRYDGADVRVLNVRNPDGAVRSSADRAVAGGGRWWIPNRELA